MRMPTQPYKRASDLFTDQRTSLRMRGIRRASTAPEMAVRHALTEMGCRYRLNNRGLPGSPDVANRAKRWAVFVHGCFWHRHQNCVRATTPKRNARFWKEKFEQNIVRDSTAVGALRLMGFRVIVIWECEVEGPALRSKLRSIAKRKRLAPK